MSDNRKPDQNIPQDFNKNTQKQNPSRQIPKERSKKI